MADDASGGGIPLPSQILTAFLKIGALAFGGVYSMLAFFQRELVDRRGWLTQDEFADAVSVGQMTPGPPIINTGLYIGYRLRGMPGALAAAAGLVLPGFVIVLTLGIAYLHYVHVPAVSGVLRAVGAAVVGLLASVVLRMFRGTVKRRTDMLYAAAAFGLFVFARMNPIALIALAGVAGIAAARMFPGRAGT